jgi:hypothetical protein
VSYYRSCFFGPAVFPSVVIPTYYTAPAYYVPVQPVVYSAATCYTTAPQSPSIYQQVSKPVVQSPSKAQFTTTKVGTKYIGTKVSEPALPEQLLAAADAILKAGGYREAAAAYAQLSVRYGSSDLLFARRFVAQVASGDVEQAVVIAASAELAGYHLDKSSLPAETLTGLGVRESLVADRSEALAALAYRRSDDADALLALGRWMHLSGDEPRAELFIARARQIADEVPEIPQPRSTKTEFVSLDK